jgi:hypothetical protein
VGKRPCSVPCPLFIGGLDFLGVHHSPYPSYMPLIRHALSWRVSSLVRSVYALSGRCVSRMLDLAARRGRMAWRKRTWRD